MGKGGGSAAGAQKGKVRTRAASAVTIAPSYEGSDTLVATDAGGNEVGLAMVRDNAVLAVEVLPRARKQDVGTRLVQAAEKQIRASGAKTIVAANVMRSAQGFWKKLGYAPLEGARVGFNGQRDWVKQV